MNFCCKKLYKCYTLWPELYISPFKGAKTMHLTVKSVFRASTHNRIKRPLFLVRIAAGFPSPADDYIEKHLDLNEHLVKHPSATFFVQVEGESMINAGIHNGDILIVDRSLEASDKKIIVAVVNGELTVKRVRKDKDALFLVPENADFKPLCVTEEMDFHVWGVVTSVIHKV